MSTALERVSLGEEITIARDGEAIARLVPAAQPLRRRQLGWASGEFAVPDFDAPLPPGIEESFYR
ncbi:MAG: hypothetical protein ABR987_25230 [Terracidiphilus sp.]|jgi:antitoxin (DNA-binding transcriptional repressor) of toxin-antitoxin stability system